MSLDLHAYTVPARVRTLLVPIGDVSQAQFEKYAELVRSSFDVRLVDVTPTKRKLFNPQGFPSGRVIYDIGTSINDQETLLLHDFEPFRKTFVVIGLSNDPATSNEHIEKLSKIYKSSIVHSIIVFDTDSKPPAENGLIFHHTTRNIETIMCDITNKLLDSLSDYYTSYQHLTLRSPASIGETDRTKTLTKQKKRISSGSAISLSLTDPSQSKISLTTANERRQSRIKGRQQKILGNAYLLAGRYTDALREFNEAIILLKSSNDSLWLASALEGIGVSIVMLDFVKVQYQFPSSLVHLFNKRSLVSSSTPATPSASPRSSVSNSPAAIEISNIPTHELIYHISIRILHYYDLSRAEVEDCVPNLVFCETILRLLKFMTALNIGGGYSDDVLNNIVKDIPLVPNTSADLPQGFNKLEILKLSNKILSIQLRKMDILSQARIYSSLSSIYGDLNLQRKRGFILRTLFVSLVPELSNAHSSYTNHDLTDLLNSLLAIYGIGDAPESLIKDSFSSRWIQLHKSIVKLCIIICEKSKDFQNVALLKSLLLTRYFHSLTENDQTKLLNDIKYLSKHYDIDVNYFDPFLLRGVEVVKGSNVPRKEESIDTPKNKDPFIYNPYLKQEIPVESNILVQGEFSEFNLTLQNPFAFQLEINDIQIEGLEIFKSHFIIAPKSISTITLLTKPLKYGESLIETVKIKIFDCISQDFKIIESTNIEEFQYLKKPTREAYANPSQVLSLYNNNLSENNVSERVETSKLPLEIVPSQPNIQIMTQINPILLLEGGRQTIQLKLKNNSETSANYIEFSTLDSTHEPLKKALENKDLPANEVYEFEYFLLKNPLNILTELKEIKPFEEVVIDAEIRGKRGLNKINLFLNYGHKVDKETYTRRLDISIPVAVNSCIDIAGCDIIPLAQNINSAHSSSFWEFINSSKLDASAFVLFLLDVRNVWNKPVIIDLDFQGFKIVDTVVPLETKRLIIPIKRFSIPLNVLKAIPSLSKKQYILPKISKAEDIFQRESFWYREEILKTIRGFWSMGDVQGDVEFRAIRLSQRMLNVLKVETVDISVKLQEVEFEKHGLYHCIKTDELFSIKVRIQNNSHKQIRGLLRNVPMSLSYGSVDRRLLFNGSLQQTVAKSLKIGDVYEFEIGIVILERGDYEWGVIFDAIDSEDQHVSRIPLRIKGV